MKSILIFFGVLFGMIGTSTAQQQVGHYSFTDSAGNSVRLSDFNGKIIVLDIWYTGCGGCAYFYQNTLKGLEEEFRADTNVVFLSICMDKERETWLGSVKTGEYTGNDAINLYTGGKHFKHDMVVQQQLDSAPHSQIIDHAGYLTYMIRRPHRLSLETYRELVKSIPASAQGH